MLITDFCCDSKNIIIQVCIKRRSQNWVMYNYSQRLFVYKYKLFFASQCLLYHRQLWRNGPRSKYNIDYQKERFLFHMWLKPNILSFWVPHFTEWASLLDRNKPWSLLKKNEYQWGPFDIILTTRAAAPTAIVIFYYYCKRARTAMF